MPFWNRNGMRYKTRQHGESSEQFDQRRTDSSVLEWRQAARLSLGADSESSQWKADVTAACHHEQFKQNDIGAIFGTFPAIARQTCEDVVKTNRLDVGCILSETTTHPGPEQLDVTHPPEAGET
jgi:hypothetical protein